MTWKASRWSPPWLAGIGQRPQNVEKLRHRARIAMGDDQRQGIRLGRADVIEMDVLAVDLAVNWGKRLNRASAARQSKLSRQ